MAQVDGGDGKSRRQWIVDRIAEIRSEFDDRAQELGALVDELDRLERPVEEKRNRRLPPGWELFTGGGVVAALVAACARGLRRHWRPIAAAAGTAVGAAVIVTGLLALGSPPPRHGAAGPIPRPGTTRSGTQGASAAGGVSASPGPSSTARQKQPRPSGIPVPIIAPTRTRRPSGAPTSAPSTPAGPGPTPTRPGPSPTPSVPVPSPFSCPIGLQLEILGLGTFVCV